MSTVAKYIWMLFIVALLSACSWGMVVASRLQSEIPPATERRTELTQTDVFLDKYWDSKAIEVLGFHLQMSRNQAKANAQKQSLRLVEPWPLMEHDRPGERLGVYDKTEVFLGVYLKFDFKDQLREIDVARFSDFAPRTAKKEWVGTQLKGDTYTLLNRYTDTLRLKLLGPEANKEVLAEKDPSLKGMVRYKYPARGLAIFAYYPLNNTPPSQSVDITFELTVPEPNPQK